MPKQIFRYSWSGRNWVIMLVAVLSVAGMAHVFIRTSSYGAGVAVDAVWFVSGALNLLDGHGLTSFENVPLVYQPPLYPLLIALLGFFGIEVVEAGCLINVICFGLIIFASGMWMTVKLRSNLVAVGATVLVMVSYLLNDESSLISTEPLFILFTLIALFCIGELSKEGTGWGALALAGVFSALATVSRYPGVTLIFVGLTVLMMLPRGFPFSVRLKRAFWYGAISSVPLAVVLLRNQMVSGTFTGHRSDYIYIPIPDLIGEIIAGFHRWIVVTDSADWWAYVLWSVFLGTVAAMSAVLAVYRYRTRRDSNLVSTDVGGVFTLSIFVVLYFIFLFAVIPANLGVRFEDRLILPIFLAVVFLGAFLFDRFLEADVKGVVKVAKWFLASVMIVLCISHIGFTARLNLDATFRALDSGYIDQSFNTTYWDRVKVLDHLESEPIQGPIWSNRSHLLWFKDYSDDLQASDAYYRLRADLDRMLKQFGWLEEPAHIVWFSEFSSDSNYTGFDLYFLPGAELLAEYRDGMIYRVDQGQEPSIEVYNANRRQYADKLLGRTGDLIIKSDFNVHLGDGELIYVKHGCTQTDIDAPFFLHLETDDVADIPDYRQKSGFDNLDFYFNQWGMHIESKCLARVPLPEYSIDWIATGQYVSGGRQLWRGDYNAAMIETLEVARDLRAEGGEPAIRSVYDVYLYKGKLVYVKQPCSFRDREARFFLHVYPLHVADLPSDRVEYGFDNLDFSFNERGNEVDGECFTAIELPTYEIASIRTGQWVHDEGRIWDETIHMER